MNGRAADDERCAGFINQDGVHLVHDGEVMAALDLFFFARRHAVVAEIIKTELGVRAVGDVTIVLLATDAWRLVVQNAADGQAKKFVNRTHPLGVARGEVIVDRHEMDAAPGERVEINGQGGDERFAFAGGHFGDAPAVQGVAADELHIERNHLPEQWMLAHDDFRLAFGETAAGVFDDSERFGQDLIERLGQLRFVLNLRESRLPIGGFLAQLVVRKLLKSGLGLVDAMNERPKFFHFAIILRPENPFQKIHSKPK